MAEFKSTPVGVNAPAEVVFNKLSDLNGLKDIISNLPASAIPEDKKEALDGIRITDDTISFPAGPVGEVTLQVTEKVSPTLVKLEGINTPVAMSLALRIALISSDTCEAQVVIDIAIPAMLKPMIGGTLQKMADQFAQVIGSLKYN